MAQHKKQEGNDMLGASAASPFGKGRYHGSGAKQSQSWEAVSSFQPF